MLITARAVRYVSEQLNVPVLTTFTGSQINLYRIKRGYKPYKVWVGTRVKEITELVEANKWPHYPTRINPADLAFRGCSAQELLTLSLWWNGPSFLKEKKEKKDYWPKDGD
jgi:hypothetical protein